MKNLVWVGIRESEIKYSNFINNSISIFGTHNTSLQNQIKKSINHNDKKHSTLINNFYNKEVISQIEKNPNTKFMYYSQIYSYHSMKKLGLLDRIICLNRQNLIEFINNKFKIKEYLKNYIPILSHTYIDGKNYNFEKLKQQYGSNHFVIQTEIGSGGFSTIVLTENNQANIKLKHNCTYMVTKYCENNLPVNIHILISQNNITLLPPSLQNIELSSNRLLYKGCDFIAYKTLVSTKTDSKLKEYTLIIGKLLQAKGYRGILGIDSIIYNDEIYFMEINPRFQNSSTILNYALQENNLPSLQELHYNCFFNKSINIKPFNVNYSSYINEFGSPNKKIKAKPIAKLDNSNQKIKSEKFSYLSTDLYNQPIQHIPLNNLPKT